jgi:hypothetical protein
MTATIRRAESDSLKNSVRSKVDRGERNFISKVLQGYGLRLNYVIVNCTISSSIEVAAAGEEIRDKKFHYA